MVSFLSWTNYTWAPSTTTTTTTTTKKVSGGADSKAVVYDHGVKKVVASLVGHEKKVTAAIFHPSNNDMVRKERVGTLTEEKRWSWSWEVGSGGISYQIDDLEKDQKKKEDGEEEECVLVGC
jgi:hypothetical protein